MGLFAGAGARVSARDGFRCAQPILRDCDMVWRWRSRSHRSESRTV